jgi:hypothetical protein
MEFKKVLQQFSSLVTRHKYSSKILDPKTPGKGTLFLNTTEMI